ncbi:MAG: sensor histidine kinase, partial [Bacteroidota bacterium]
YMRSPDNPITLSAIVLYWITAVYLLFPRFFKKYKIIILSVYGVVLSYFIISRMMPNYQEDHHLRVINLLVIPIPFLVAMGIYDQWHWLTVLQADKAKTELTLLKSQINPHFFFNTLNNLYGLAMEKSDEAPRVILRLSDMMRYTIYKGKEETVSLKDEIDYLQNYIELHKIRYQKEVEVSFVHDVEEHLQVAPLLFIIPLENAFKHGVEKMREGAFIHLQMHTRDDQLIFAIENSYEKAPSHQPRGIGLDNLQKRLQHSYPNRHELIIDQEESIYKFQLTLVLT